MVETLTLMAVAGLGVLAAVALGALAFFAWGIAGCCGDE